MQTYRVLKPRFVFAHVEYGEGESVTARPTALLRRAVVDGDLELVTPAVDKKRKERSEP
jgi:hypothetical protein